MVFNYIKFVTYEMHLKIKFTKFNGMYMSFSVEYLGPEYLSSESICRSRLRAEGGVSCVFPHNGDEGTLFLDFFIPLKFLNTPNLVFLFHSFTLFSPCLITRGDRDLRVYPARGEITKDYK